MFFKAFIAVLAFSMGLGVSSPSSAGFDYREFKAMAVMDGGRVKPLDTYARSLLLQISSKSTYKEKSAIEWLAGTIFDSKANMDDRIFRINNIDVAYGLGIEPDKTNHYSFMDLGPVLSKLSQLSEAAMKIDEKSRTPVEAELIRLASNMSQYLGVMNSFLFCTPNPDFRITDSALAASIGLPLQTEPYSYWDIRGKMSALMAIAAPAMSRGNSAWTPLETAAFHVVQNFQSWSENYQSYPIHVLPPANREGEMWLSPWNKIPMATLDADSKKGLQNLVDAAIAYRTHNPEAFKSAVKQFNNYVVEKGKPSFNPWKIKLELIYNGLDAFYRAELLYGLAMMASLLGLLFLRRWLYPLGILLLGSGALLHAAGIGLRMSITGRPPITNLFETFVFVGWMGAMLGLTLEWFTKKGMGLLGGSITALAVLLLSSRYNTDGDTIGVLVAVLNSNFWLTTHVITISLGYSGFCVAGVIGHIYLIQAIVNRHDREKLDSLAKMIYGVMAFGLLFSFIGTVLGGVWADQSWGRFWGWDPKENGALIIVLWGSLLFHAKLGKMIGPLGMAVGSVLGIIVVMMAWFGINLLGVGLHSYGFTSGVANSLTAYVISEVVFLIAALFWIQRNTTYRRGF